MKLYFCWSNFIRMTSVEIRCLRAYIGWLLDLQDKGNLLTGFVCDIMYWRDGFCPAHVILGMNLTCAEIKAFILCAVHYGKEIMQGKSLEKSFKYFL